MTDQCWYTYVGINSRPSLNKQPSLAGPKATRSENNERSVISHRAGGPDQAKTQLWGRFVKYHSIFQPGTYRGIVPSGPENARSFVASAIRRGPQTKVQPRGPRIDQHRKPVKITIALWNSSP